MQRSFPPIVKYVLAIAITGVALLLRWAIDPWLGSLHTLVAVQGAVAVAVWLGGWRPALLVTALGYLASDYLFIGSSPGFDFTALPYLVGLAAHLTVCGIIIGFGEAVRRTGTRAEQRGDLLQTTLASIGDAVITTDISGQVTYLNPVAAALTGYSNEAGRGLPLERVFKIVNEITRESVENPAARALREGVVVGLANHTVLIAKDGSEHPVDDSAAPIRDRDGVVVGCVLVFRDISERHRAEQALRRSEGNLSDFFDNAAVGIQWAGADGRILRVNEAQLNLLGYSRDDYLGRQVAEFHVDPTAINDMLARLRRGETLREHPAQLRCKDGSIRDVLINANGLFEDGKFVHSRYFILDITDRKRADQVRARLAAIVEDSDDAIISMDLDGVVQSWNAGAERVFGYAAEQMAGRPINTIIPPQLHDDETMILGRIRNGERVDHYETVRLAKSGRRIYVSLTVSPIFDEAGKIIGASKVSRDITERKRAEAALRASEQRFRLMADAAPVLIWITGTDKGWTWVNKQWLGFVGRSLEQELAFGWTEHIHPDDFGTVMATYGASFDAREAFSLEYRLQRRDGEYRWMMVTGTPLYHAGGDFGGYIGSAIDISDRIDAEGALRNANRRKDEFLAILAHELRNPLAPIRNSLEVLKLGTGDLALQRQARDTMDRQLSHMVRLVDDLLDVSRITRDKLDLRCEIVELAPLIQQAVETVEPLAAADQHTIDIQMPPEPIYLHADAVRLTQVFSNLLANACKFMAPHGRIDISVAPKEQQVTISVRDNGMGIDAGKLESIFDMFAQAETEPGRASGGLGIGLTLAKRLVQMHGGSIFANSGGVGQGSEFVVELPRVAAPAQQHPLRPSKPRQIASRRVLVVDDNRDSADSLAMLLQTSGHSVAVAYDGEDAIAKTDSFKPDLLLLDIGLPKMNGYEVCRHLRAREQGQRLAIVALTGWGQQEDRRKAEEAGFDHLLVKPVDYETLLQLLDSLSPAESVLAH